jgi:hypothetical protein
MRIKDLITSRVCGNTVFENSWLWYCDDCRQHGTAMSAEEADYFGNAHALWNSYAVEEGKDEEDDYIMYGSLSPEERSKYEWDNCETCIVYIIDEGNNITYDLGDDYADKTPNQVADLDTMIKLQKDLGLE